MCIRDSAVTIERKAKNNKKVSRRSQLSVLWKIEMKNLLIKNNLPLYAQREKGFIADKIVESVSSDILQPQIAQELMNRDYSVYDAEDYTIRSDKTESGNRDVVLNLVDELSEKNFEDFTLDQWIGMYQKAKRVQVKKEKIFKVPVERPPHKISYTDIEAVPGVPWIGQEIINDFVNQVLMEGWYSYKTVEYEPVTETGLFVKKGVCQLQQLQL